MSFTEVFGGSTIYPSGTTYLPLSMSADVDLAWPIEQQIGGDIVADIIDVTALAASLSINLPDARQVSTGYTALFNNVGANTVTVKDDAGGTIISVAPGTAWQIYLRDNSTAAGLWRTFQYGASVSVAVASALAGAGLKAITTTLNFALPVTNTSTTPLTLVTADRAKFLNWTGGVGTVNLPAPGTVGNDWNTILRNSGSGNWTVTPPSGTIDGTATKVLAPGDSCLVVTDGTNFLTLSGGGSSGGSGFNFITINVAGAGTYTLSGAELDKIGYSFTGILTGTRNIVVPGTTQEYWASNDTTGAFSLFVKTALQVPGVEVLQNTRNILYCDGTNVKSAESNAVSFPVAIAQGGTGAITAATARTALGVPPDTRTITAGAGLTGGGNLTADRTLAVSMLGIQSLVDPNADRIMFWDDSTGFVDWLTVGTGLQIVGTTLSSTNPVSKVKTAATTKTANAAIAADPHLTGWALTAGKSYRLSGCLTGFWGAAQGFKWQLVFSNAPQYASGALFIMDGNGAAPATPTWAVGRRSGVDSISSGCNAAVDGVFNFEAVFQANAVTGGTVDFGWAQNTSNASGTILDKGSCIQLSQLD